MNGKRPFGWRAILPTKYPPDMLNPISMRSCPFELRVRADVRSTMKLDVVGSHLENKILKKKKKKKESFRSCQARDILDLVLSVLIYASSLLMKLEWLFAFLYSHYTFCQNSYVSLSLTLGWKRGRDRLLIFVVYTALNLLRPSKSITTCLSCLIQFCSWDLDNNTLLFALRHMF